MGLRCNYCDKDLGYYPEDAVEEGQLEEVIGHKQKEKKHSPYISKKDYYCSIECFVEKANQKMAKEETQDE